ncbi:MAG: hypothetical protein FJ221_04850 [Lentisphaerae bacterium]|nr:hypothetical protein [Lentisphaerota bacterium]
MSRLRPVIGCLLFAMPAVMAADPAVVTVDTKRKPTDKTWTPRETRSVAAVDGWESMRAPPLNRYGGRTDRKLAAPGFFRVLKNAEGWTMADPDGCAWYSVGVCSVSPGKSGRGREALKEKFGDEDGWARATLDLLRTNGFNTTACFSDWATLRRATNALPYMTQLNMMARYGSRHRGAWQTSGHLAFSNNCIHVFDPAFETHARTNAAAALAEVRDDPLCVGHFSDNELPFPDDALDRFLALPAGDPGRKAAEAWVKERGAAKGPKGWGDADRSSFLSVVADRYFAICAAAIRAADPNHLYLGSRLHGSDHRKPDLYRACGAHVDIVSMNYYGVWSPDPAKLAPLAAAAGRPLMVTEWYAKGMDSGMGNISGAGWTVKTQRERGLYYQNFALGLLESPHFVGWHWFKYIDNDPTDTRSDPSNRDSNKGIVNNVFKPYPDLLDRMRALNERVWPVLDRR